MINGVKGLSVLTLHDSHADLFDVLIARLFTLEGRKDDLIDFMTVSKTFMTRFHSTVIK